MSRADADDKAPWPQGLVDPGAQLAAVRRAVVPGSRDGRETKVLTISQVYDAGVEDVWDALTNPERIPRWFLPVTGELKPGGHYQLEGNAGGTVTECEPPNRFAATWEFGGGVSWIDVRVEEEPGGGARFTLEHIAHPEEHWKLYGPAAVGIGWELAILSLATHLSGVERIDPALFLPWSASPEGVAYMTDSGDRWYAADVEGGAEPAAARTSADRTIAFYTGAVPEPGASAT